MPTTAATGDLERAYVALVWNIPARMTGTVDAPLGRAADRVRRAVVPAGRDDARHAVTHYTVLERFGEGQDADAAGRAWSSAGWKPAAPTRSASTWPISAIR